MIKSSIISHSKYHCNCVSLEIIRCYDDWQGVILYSATWHDAINSLMKSIKHLVMHYHKVQ